MPDVIVLKEIVNSLDRYTVVRWANEFHACLIDRYRPKSMLSVGLDTISLIRMVDAGVVYNTNCIAKVPVTFQDLKDQDIESFKDGIRAYIDANQTSFNLCLKSMDTVKGAYLMETDVYLTHAIALHSVSVGMFPTIGMGDPVTNISQLTDLNPLMITSTVDQIRSTFGNACSNYMYIDDQMFKYIVDSVLVRPVHENSTPTRLVRDYVVAYNKVICELKDRYMLNFNMDNLLYENLLSHYDIPEMVPWIIHQPYELSASTVYKVEELLLTSVRYTHPIDDRDTVCKIMSYLVETVNDTSMPNNFISRVIELVKLLPLDAMNKVMSVANRLNNNVLIGKFIMELVRNEGFGFRGNEIGDVFWSIDSSIDSDECLSIIMNFYINEGRQMNCINDEDRDLLCSITLEALNTRYRYINDKAKFVKHLMTLYNMNSIMDAFF